MALIVTYGALSGFRTSWGFILVGHVLFTLPFMVRSVLAVLMAIDLQSRRLVRRRRFHRSSKP